MKPRALRRPLPIRPSAPAPPDILGEHDGVVFQRERLGPILREILPLLHKDWQENGIDRERVPLQIDTEKYLDYDLIGILQIVTARDRGALIGYMWAFVHPHIDHRTLGWAILSWYWLYPAYRGGGVGNAMLQAMEDFLRSAKVSVIEASEKIAARHGLFERRGYAPTDKIYRKLLE